MQTLQQQQQQQQSPATYTYAHTPVAAQPPDLNLPDFESLLQKIMESCTKDSISVSIPKHDDHHDHQHNYLYYSVAGL